MSTIFLLQVGLSFLVGGLYISLMSRVAEKFGSKLGGFLIALPSVVLVGLSFIAWTQPTTLQQAVVVMPATIAAASVFLVAFTLFSRYGKWRAYLLALAVWICLNLPLVLLKLPSIWWGLMIAVCLFALSIAYSRNYPHTRVKQRPRHKWLLFFRFMVSGSFVALAVVLAKILGPTWGGLMASFPVVFSVTALLMTSTHGIGFMSSMSRTMVNGAMINVIFVVAIYILVPYVGNVFAIVYSYFIALLAATLSYFFIAKTRHVDHR